MKVLIQLLFFTLLSVGVFARDTLSLGEMRLVNCEIKSRSVLADTLYGCITSVQQWTIEAKTEVQMSCNYGNPSRNQYKTQKNTLTVSYAYDSTGAIYDSLLLEIGRYITRQEEWSAKCPQPTTDFSYLPFNESFYVNDKTVSLHLWSGSERNGDFKIYYVNHQVYKIQLIEGIGLGCISAFTRQNMMFERDGKKLELGRYVKNTAIARDILNEELEKQGMMSDKDHPHAFVGKILNAKDSSVVAWAAVYTDDSKNADQHTYEDGRFINHKLQPGLHTFRVQLETYHDTTYSLVFDSAIDSTYTFYYNIRCDYDQSGIIHDCPQCKKQDEVIRIVYGYPAPETIEKAQRHEIYLGGCIVSDCDPHWFCMRCKIEF